MVCYDRLTEKFVLQEENETSDNLIICNKLNQKLADIQSWLSLKRLDGRYSHGFIAELTMKSCDRAFHIHSIYDEIGKLEGTDPRPSITKKPRQMRFALSGLWHKHYFQPSFISRNLLEETEKMNKDGRWEAIFASHYGKYIHEFIEEISYKMVVGAYEQRAADRRITGEFIVYEKQPDGSNYYLTIGKHGEWDEILARVEEYKKFDSNEN